MSTLKAQPANTTAATMLNKVPVVLLFFWVIKIMATTVGETAADFLAGNLGLGLANTTWLSILVLIGALVVQFRVKKYVPGIYWFAVVAISIVGALITDTLTDSLGVSLWVSTPIFALALLATFAAWHSSERTLSIHTIFTTRREAFYWLAVLFTFALGTAAGDLLAETLSLGYLISAVLFALLIAAVVVAWRSFGLDSVLAFWLAYILTRPLGASLGDLLSQSPADGGLGGVPPGTLVLGRQDLIVRVLLNLLENAVRYTPAAGSVAMAAERDGGRLRVTVSDTGPGIAADHLPFLFDRFYRVEAHRARDGADPAHGGSGLGLFIAREIARRLGGDVGASSTVGQGTRIMLWLRAAPNADVG